ncbi:ABC transporter ATP-binding protein [Hungatella hathewayi]|uniref:ABC transporter ATP-binding protein n=1 Tax=Hungatella hathewayi TaxID=154046 RepID=UPI003564172D
MNGEEKKFVSVKDLVIEYTSGGSIIHAVNGISFDLAEGRTLGLVGETGAGKTSIAKAIMRILPDPPAKIRNGEIFIEGEDILKKPEKDMLEIRGDKIAMIFQDPMTALNPVKTIGEQIAEGILLHNQISKGDARDMAIDMLKMVGITEERYEEYPFQFSGGMKQRVVIAMALACKPKLLIADEPTTALDVTIQAQVLEMIRDLKTQLNTSMILITHDLGVIAEMCDEVAVVYAGQIVEYGKKADIFKHTAHPYTIGLFRSLPGLSMDEPRLHPIEGLPPDPSNLPGGCSFSPRCPHATEECRKTAVKMKELASGHHCRCLYAKRED